MLKALASLVLMLTCLACERLEPVPFRSGVVPRGSTVTLVVHGRNEPVRQEIQRVLHELGFRVASDAARKEVLQPSTEHQGASLVRGYSTAYVCVVTSDQHLQLIDAENGRILFALARLRGRDESPRGFANHVKRHLSQGL